MTAEAGASALETTPVEPIILEDANDYVASQLWQLLCGELGDGWKREVGRLGLGHPTFEDMMNAWVEGLTRQLRHPDRHREASRILARLREYKAEVEHNRSRYRFVSPEMAQHRYWPTGKREHMERENLYTMNLCPQRHPFITRQTPITAAGNCFAMNMGQTLRQWGYNYFIKDPGPGHLSPQQLWERKYGHFSARQGIIFNTPSLRQWVERGLGLIELQPYLWYQDDLWHDPYREEVPFDNPEEYAADLPVFLRALRETLLEAEVLILSPSVNEVWRFKHDGSYLSRVPWRLSPALLERNVLSVEENVAHLQQLLDVLTAHNPNVRIIMTVSPVPLLATFRSEEMNVVVADCHGKATLRVAAEEFANRNDNATYFPAYEAVTYGSRQQYLEDGRHVHPDAIERAMRIFRETYCVG